MLAAAREVIGKEPSPKWFAALWAFALKRWNEQEETNPDACADVDVYHSVVEQFVKTAISKNEGV